MARILAISGPPGSGKTSLAIALARKLGGAPTLHFDRYEEATNRSPDSVKEWAARGAPFEEITTGRLKEDIETLRGGGAVDGPEGRMQANDWAVLDTQFGRAHPASAGQVDVLVWIDLAADIALARKIRTMSAVPVSRKSTKMAVDFTAWLHQYLMNYQDFVSDLYRLQEERVRPAADLVVDGRKDIDILAESVLANLRWSLDEPGGSG